MGRRIRPGFVSAAIALALVPEVAASQPVVSADSSFNAFLRTFEAATQSFLEGDNRAWKDLLSTEPGGTLFTPFGGVVQGIAALREQYDRAASVLGPGPARLRMEYLSVDVSGDLAYVVVLQRSLSQVGGRDSGEEGYTRATMVFRREAGRWKLRHRHMDHLEPPPC